MATSDDVVAQQVVVQGESTNIAIAMQQARSALPPERGAAWDVLAGQCLRFTGKAPVFGLVHVMYAEGLGLLAQLSWWRATLESSGYAVPSMDWNAAPHVTPPPGPGLLDQLSSSMGPVVLIALYVWYQSGQRGR